VYETVDPHTSYDCLQLLITEFGNSLVAGLKFGQQELARILWGPALLLLILGLI
jgi:hypothetical protein